MAKKAAIRLKTHTEMPKPRSNAPFTRAAVIGAGIMGAGIAAHLASCLPDNGEFNVTLLDKFPETASKAVEKQRKGSQSVDKMQRKPWEGNFLDPAFSKRIECGTTDDDIEQIADADFIQEAVFEDLAIKVEVWSNLIRNCKDGAYIVSNTSSIPYKTIYDALPQDVKDLATKKNVTLGLVHWFNPPRFNPLVEIYLPPETDQRKKKILFDFVRKNLGKSPEACRDNPGFIGNHYGVPVLKFALDFMVEHGMQVEDVDAVLGRNVGFYGVLKLVDMVGADIAASVIKSLRERLPDTHPFQTDSKDIPFILDMIAKKRTGGKSPDEEGFYRYIDDPEKPRKKKKQVIDLATFEYRDAIDRVELESTKAGRRGLRDVVESNDIGGKLAWYVLSKAIVYAAGVVQDIAQDINQLDRTMRSGFDWKRGPFQMIDAFAKDDELGIDYIIRRFSAENIPVPQLLLDMTQKTENGKIVSQPFYREENGVSQYLDFNGNYIDIEKEEGVLDLEDIKAVQKPIDGNDYASLWDLGDGVLCAELHGMANSLSPTTMDILNSAADMIEDGQKGFKSLVIYSPKSNFAIGANLGLVSLMANLGNHENKEKIDDALYVGQMTLERLKYAKFPVIAAVRGMALGGGCEVMLHSDRVVAHAEIKPGLVEAGVGLEPAWGGQAEMLERHIGEAKTKKAMESASIKALTKISTGYVAPSAFVARRDLFLRPNDKIVMNSDLLLAEAKAEAIAMTPDYQPPKPIRYRLGGGQTQALMRSSIDSKYRQQRATWQDIIALDGIVRTLSGGRTDFSRTVSRHKILELERQGFMNSVSTYQTRGGRIRHTLNTSKPLREDALLASVSPTALRSLIRTDYLVKPRPEGNPYIKTNNTDTPQAANNAIDYKAMKGQDVVNYLLDRIANDHWTAPAPSDRLRDIYNKVSADTRSYMQGQIKGLSAFALSGKSVVLSAAFSFLAQKTQQSEKILKSSASDDDKAVHAARIENYKHYKKEVEALRVLMG